MTFRLTPFNASLEEVAARMNRKTVYFVDTEKIIKVTQDHPSEAVYVAHVGNVTIVCKAYINGTFIVKTVGW